MATSQCKQPSKRFRLNERSRTIASKSADPLIRDVHKMLEEFEYSEAVGVRYAWKYLPNETFIKIYCSHDTTAYTMNRALLSHLARVIEAFEVVSVWRAWELLGSCITSLNDDCLIPAATLGRSLIELTVTYGQAANILYSEFQKYPWDSIRTQFVGLDHTDEHGKKVGLESFVERLMSGTKLQELLESSPDMEQQNILTIIDKMDKKLLKQQYGYTVRPHYEFLCELAHPNTIGYQRFMTSVRDLNSGWTERFMEAKSTSQHSIHILEECLWALSFSSSGMNGCFGVFQDLKKNLGQHLGRPLPN